MFSTQKAPTFGHICTAASEMKTWSYQILLISIIIITTVVQSPSILRLNLFCLSVLTKQLCIKSACNFVPMSRLTLVRIKVVSLRVLYEFQNCNYRASINLHWIITTIITSSMPVYFQANQMQPMLRAELISHCLL